MTARHISVFILRVVFLGVEVFTVKLESVSSEI